MVISIAELRQLENRIVNKYLQLFFLLLIYFIFLNYGLAAQWLHHDNTYHYITTNNGHIFTIFLDSMTCNMYKRKMVLYWHFPLHCNVQHSLW